VVDVAKAHVAAPVAQAKHAVGVVPDAAFGAYPAEQPVITGVVAVPKAQPVPPAGHATQPVGEEEAFGAYPVPQDTPVVAPVHDEAPVGQAPQAVVLIE